MNDVNEEELYNVSAGELFIYDPSFSFYYNIIGYWLNYIKIVGTIGFSINMHKCFVQI